MYRLVLYYLIAILVAAVIFAFFKVLPYDPVYIILSSLFLAFFGGFINDVFAKVFSSPLNTESAYITGLILALIISPVRTLADFSFLAWAIIFAMGSKFILSFGKKHIFNPAAIAVVITAFLMNQSASWWVGNLALFPVVLVGGLLIVRKTRREHAIFMFILTALLSVAGFTLIKGGDVINVLNKVIFHSSLPFFAFAMVTEPLTMPTTYNYQLIFSAIVGFIFVPDVHIANIFSTPELALVVGNLFAYIVNPKDKLLLRLKEKIKLTEDTYDFIFPLDKKLNFLPGQYMEWTYAHDNVDDRGNRRYFTLASSPTEDNVRVGIKFYNPPSSYKKNLLSMDSNQAIVASQLSGDFTLPKNPKEKLVFIAGGIGVTPFRSIIKYLVDVNEKRDIVVFYSNKYESEIVYRDVFSEAENKLGIKTVYALTDQTKIAQDWAGERGRINADMVKKYVPDFSERIFYLSGPRSMVDAFENVLKNMGVKKEKIKTDFFPGFV